jgi:O-antigen/teichoic acid export membrane protein
VFALLDQMVVSAARFGVAIAMARLTVPENYGRFVLALNVILLLEVLQAAAVTWPLFVLGAAKAGKERAAYLGSMLTVQTALAALLAALVGLAGWSTPASLLDAESRGTLLAACPALFFGQLQEFLRRVLLTTVRAGAALLNDCVLALLQLATLAFLWRWGGPAALGSAYVLLGVSFSALCACLLGSFQVRGIVVVGGRSAWGSALRESWEFGRYILGSRLGEGLLAHAHAFVVVQMAGLASTAALEASRLLLAPIQVASFGILNLLVPAGTREAQAGRPRLRRFVNRAALIGFCVFGAYALALGTRPVASLEILYGGRYGDGLLLRLWCVGYVFVGVRVILSAILYVGRRPDAIMRAALFCGVGSVIAAVPLTAALGERGAVLARVGSEAVLFLAIWWLTRQVPPERASGIPAC